MELPGTWCTCGLPVRRRLQIRPVRHRRIRQARRRLQIQLCQSRQSMMEPTAGGSTARPCLNARRRLPTWRLATCTCLRPAAPFSLPTRLLLPLLLPLPLPLPLPRSRTSTAQTVPTRSACACRPTTTWPSQSCLAYSTSRPTRTARIQPPPSYFAANLGRRRLALPIKEEAALAPPRCRRREFVPRQTQARRAKRTERRVWYSRTCNSCHWKPANVVSLETSPLRVGLFVSANPILLNTLALTHTLQSVAESVRTDAVAC